MTYFDIEGTMMYTTAIHAKEEVFTASWDFAKSKFQKPSPYQLLLSENQGETDHNSGTTTMLVSAATTFFGSLLVASYLAKRKEAARLESDSFVRM